MSMEGGGTVVVHVYPEAEGMGGAHRPGKDGSACRCGALVVRGRDLVVVVHRLLTVRKEFLTVLGEESSN